MGTQPDPVRERLDRIVHEYGRNALTDAVALRAAWRGTAGTVVDEPPSEIVAIAAEAGRAGPDRSPDDLVAPAAAASGLPAERLGPAARVLSDALAGRPSRPGTDDGSDRAATAGAGGTGGTGGTGGAVVEGPTAPPRTAVPSAPRLVWDDDVPAPDGPVAPAGPPDAPTTRVPRRPGRRAVLAAGAAVLVAVAAAVVVPRLPASGDGPAAGEDLYAVAAVADRYRALGPDLLAGASRCGALPPAGAEVERVGCDVEGRAMILRTYPTPDALRTARTDAVPRTEVVRSTRRTRDDGEIALSEQATGASTVAWDATLPRPVGAVVTGRESLVDLTAFLDRRRFTLLPRPEVPGPMFRSGRLWALASGHVPSTLATGCAALQPNETEQEIVECDLPGGRRAKFVVARDRTAFQTARRDFADDAGTRPGTRTVTAWNRNEGPTVGLLVQYVTLEGRPALYYDDDALGGYGVLFGPAGGIQVDLLESWTSVAQPR